MPGRFPSVLPVVLVVTTACARPHADAPVTPVRPNVILVVVDTLRADHMSLYGYPRATTPFIDEFASEGVVFERARSQAGCTFPSVNSILTSRYPSDFNRQGEGQFGIPDQYRALAEILAGQGYGTVAVSASPIVRATPSKENPTGGFGRGFQIFDETCLWREAECVNRRTVDLLATVREPFFLYVHYMDPHGNYAPPPSYRKQFAGEYQGYDFIAAGDHNPIAKMLYDNGPHLEIDDRDIEHLLDLYDDEIRYFDGQFASLVANLRGRGLLDRSLVAFTSDHGEEFLEHGHIGHCRGVWDTLTRVPLFLRIPAVEGTGRVQQAVQLVDIVPTLFDYLGITPEGVDFEGTSLRPLLERKQPVRTYAFADQSKYRAADDGRWQLIFDGVESTVSLFDVRIDPLEEHDVFTTTHPEVARLSEALNTWLVDSGQWLNFDRALAANKSKEEELRALGYLQ